MRRPILAILPALLASTAYGADVTESWTLEGFEMPESAYPLPGEDAIVVSNMAGFGPDGGTDGYLSRISPEGEMLEARWVEGLSDPKGMTARDGMLYVADTGGVHVIDIAAGSLARTIPMEGAQMPNDAALGPDGAIYVTDMLGEAIWRIADDTAERMEVSGPLTLPNGISAAEDGLVVGSFGANMAPDFSVEQKGGLLHLDPGTGEITRMDGTHQVASVDGLASVAGWIVYDDNPTGAILAWKDGENRELAVLGAGAADLGARDDMIYVPNLNTNTVAAYRLEM
jgi:sugar lactone lactonase YvrE